LGGKPIGALQLHQVGSKAADQAWTEQDLALVEAILDQVAQTAENLRLFEETRERASFEQVVGEISQKLRQASSMETLVKTAAEELSRVLGTSHSLVKVGKVAQQSQTAEAQLVPSKRNGKPE
jgi:GAF domain-containing protein